MFPPRGDIKDIKKGSGFGRFEVLLQASEQLRTSASSTTAVAAAK
ncbi:hypothetical protein [Paenibacillus sp. UNC451MF]|nr:hypothetical protein [Paenibacillus sp. UNC451MF]